MTLQFFPVSKLTGVCFLEKQIIPEKCRYEILSTKVEIRLAKAELINWTSLEYSKEITVPQKVNVPLGRQHTLITYIEICEISII